jgi:hypothetical protein
MHRLFFTDSCLSLPPLVVDKVSGSIQIVYITLHICMCTCSTECGTNLVYTVPLSWVNNEFLHVCALIDGTTIDFHIYCTKVRNFNF